MKRPVFINIEVLQKSMSNREKTIQEYLRKFMEEHSNTVLSSLLYSPPIWKSKVTIQLHERVIARFGNLPIALELQELDDLLNQQYKISIRVFDIEENMKEILTVIVVLPREDVLGISSMKRRSQFILDRLSNHLLPSIEKELLEND